MLQSMTAFASATKRAEWGIATWEVRSVNHRYLDAHFRLPDSLHEAEFSWRKTINQWIQRGKVDCQLIFVPSENFAPTLHVNKELVGQLVSCMHQVQSQNEAVSPKMSALTLLKWPGVITTSPQDLSKLTSEFSALLEEALEDFVRMRQREGAEIAGILNSKLNDVFDIVQVARKSVALSFEKQKQKLINRLEELGSFEKDRVAQEMVIFASKWDVAEELDRLQCHYEEVKKCLVAKEPMGRRLDFLMQEMNREANTLASKSQDATLSKLAVDLKVIIEQMREQVQNVE